MFPAQITVGDRLERRSASYAMLSAHGFDISGPKMIDRIVVYCDSHGVWYCGDRQRLINAGLATAEMFPDDSEAWRGNGFQRDPDEPLWSVQKAPNDMYKVMWGICVEKQHAD